MILKNILLKYGATIYILFICLYIIFGRSISGLYIFDFRLAELIIGFLLFWSIITIAQFLFKKLNIKGFDLQIKLFFVLIFLFLLSFFVNGGNFSNTYTFKSSSYIWTIPTLFLSYYLIISSKFSNKYLYAFSISLPVAYFFSTIHYPIFFITFFKSYSDKWDFIKASDLFLGFVLTNTLNYLLFKNKINSFTYLVFSSSILLPLFLFMSKGAFFPAIFYSVLFLYFYIDLFKKETLKTIAILITSIFLFTASTFEVYGNLNFEKGTFNLDQIENSSFGFDSLKRGVLELSENKDTGKIFASLYFAKYTGSNRLYSTDIMLDWRLQIWQDIISDLYSKNKLFFGYGYNDMIPIMNSVERMGTDGTNENVHNYFFNVLARGGLFQLSLILLFIFAMFYEIKNKEMKKLFFVFAVPLYMTSFFDASMESVRFPLIFYTGITLIFKLDKNFLES